MADPLSALADREVPADTNYFDPEASRSIIARYSNTRREREGVKELAESAMRLSRVRDDQVRAADNRAEMARKQLLWDRDDEEYALRKDALSKQGEFLEIIGGLNTEDPVEFDRQITEVMKTTPKEAFEEPGPKALLTYKMQKADDARRRLDAETAKKQTLDNQLTTMRERAKLQMSYDVTDDDVKAATREDGSIDEMKLGMIVGANRKKYKEGEFDRRAKAVQEGRMKLADKLNLSKSARSLRDDLETYIEDPGAFPRHTDALLSEFRKTNPNASEDMMMGEWADKLAQAKAWDKKPFERELIAAQSYDDPDEYVKLGGDKLTEKQKSYRQKMWQLAHKEDVFEEVAAPATPLERQFPRVAAPVIPTPKGKKTLSPEARADILKRANGDPTKAMRLAEEEGY